MSMLFFLAFLLFNFFSSADAVAAAACRVRDTAFEWCIRKSPFESVRSTRFEHHPQHDQQRAWLAFFGC